MGRVFRILAGVLLGAAVTGGLVLLFTPQSGEDTRRMIEERIEAILAEGREAAETRRLELQSQFETLKEPVRQQ
ncbi:MAG: YtxH domain-containing protein [Anaerolineae bacterium]|jgi:gas vesicle protein